MFGKCNTYIHIHCLSSSFCNSNFNLDNFTLDMAQTLRICMLNADIPVPAVYQQRATTYGKIFHRLLCDAARAVSLHLEITSQDFNVMKSEYPSDLSGFDAILISGSASSAYDDVDWIHTLNAYIKNVYCSQPQIKIFGSCFGHQLICHALLSEHDVRVEKDPSGWEIGVKEITLDKRFREVFEKTVGSRRGVPEELRLQFVHGDHVYVPQSDALPESWITLGRTEHCAVQGVYEPGRILTFQGHFEFDRFVNGETVKFFFPTWAPDVMAKVLKVVNQDDDAVAAAIIVLDFFMGAGIMSITHGVEGGLLTPPSS
jgi:GMP synthase-like glutamine amidotransferase